MTEPKLSVRASGAGGRGYRHPHTGVIVPSVTTVLKQLNKPALVQWAVDQTAAFAVANIDNLLSRTEEQGWGFLRWYWNRDPLKGEVELRNFYNGVRDDAAELGTMIHEWIAADHGEGNYPDVSMAPEFFWQMVNVWNEWSAQHDVKPIVSEGTVWSELGGGYAGTLDGIWEIDGVRYLLDIKSSRNVYDEHMMQLAALGGAQVLMVEDGEDWVEKPIPEFDAYALLRIRPQDVDKDGNIIEPYCKLEVLDSGEMDYHLDGFLNLVQLSSRQAALKEYRKNAQKKTEF